MVEAGKFYSTYHGHGTNALDKALKSLRDTHDDSAVAIFLAGDSSLDNKTWIFNQGAPAEAWRPASAHAPATNGYEEVLRPSRMVCDVTYWMNQILADIRGNAFVLNTAIEATLLASRVGGVQCCICPTCGGLYDQDHLIRERIRPNDMLVISVGGNDIALAPSIFTVLALVLLMLTPWPLLFWFHPGVLYFIVMFRSGSMLCRQAYFANAACKDWHLHDIQLRREEYGLLGEHGTVCPVLLLLSEYSAESHQSCV